MLCQYLSSTLTVLATTSGGLVQWTRTTLSDRSPSPFILFTSFSVSNFSWYNSNSTVWDSSTDTQTGHTKHCYTMLILKVYNVCGYTVTAEGTVSASIYAGFNVCGFRKSAAIHEYIVCEYLDVTVNGQLHSSSQSMTSCVTKMVIIGYVCCSL